ncbi:MAG: ATP-binding cassette domain-containing protein [Bacteroidales bacterium]
MLLELDNISKSFGAQIVLSDVSFSIDKGEVVGFLGTNGAGKSTTMRIITGLINADCGIVRVMGEVVGESGAKLRKHIGYLPEHNPLYTDLYVREYLSYVADSYGVKGKKKRIAELVEMTKLTTEQGKKIGTLSKGYKQRLGLAQALMNNPKVLILDEPMSGLDPNQLEEMRSLIRHLSIGKTVLLSSHIMQEIEYTCSRVLIINKGSLVADKSIDKLATMKNKKYVEVEFLDELSFEEENLFFQFESIKQDGRHYVFVSERDIRSEVFRIASSNNLVILTMMLQKESLESSFKILTS